MLKRYPLSLAVAPSFMYPGVLFPLMSSFWKTRLNSRDGRYLTIRRMLDAVCFPATTGVLWLTICPGHDKYYSGKSRADWSEDTVAGADDDEDESSQQNVKLEKRYSPSTAATINLLDERLVPYDLIISLLERICFDDTNYSSFSSAVLIFMPGMGEIRRLNDLLVDHPMFGMAGSFRLYPLHSTLSSENQSAAFDVPPPGVRKIVIGETPDFLLL
jgi:hypothetical protein